MRRRSESAVTPAIATMLLITATLVLALVVGAYSSSLLGPNVDQVQLVSILLYDGDTADNITTTASASLILVLKNPDVATLISSIELSSPALDVPITSWSVTDAPQSGNSFFVNGQNELAGGSTNSFTIYPVQSPPMDISVGGTFDYLIEFSNGQSISGAIIAQ